MKKTIIVFSNPFGYGPTGNAIPVLEHLSKIQDIDLIFAGSGLCLEILPSKFKTVVLNERNELEIEKFLAGFDNPYVIGIQNRFSINVCKRKNIPCAFVDILAWFWKKIPEEHLIADEIFWLDFGDMKNKPEYNEKIHLISGIVEKHKFEKHINYKDRIIVHIGGANYPVIDDVPKNYLKLISLSLEALYDKKIFNNIFFTSGSVAIKYIKSLGLNKGIKAETLSRDEYLNNLIKSNHLITTPGVSSTLEGFYYDVPVSFLLPINLSNLALTNLLEEKYFKTHKLNWRDYVEIHPNIEFLTEKDGIKEIEKYAGIILSNKNLLDKYLNDFILLAKDIPNIEKQRNFIDRVGSTGAKELTDILIKKWKLT